MITVIADSKLNKPVHNNQLSVNVCASMQKKAKQISAFPMMPGSSTALKKGSDKNPIQAIFRLPQPKHIWSLTFASLIWLQGY